ncbi:PIN domain-like protein [Rhizoctonia solani]|uniref:PIN domain-like protein n=1 Tax=Rhizoctonia solani TaxID=456999 RepID=A0A8H7M7F0_9AGAM|nr:PIN domain-like protein [Rhizoctonia solani]
MGVLGIVPFLLRKCPAAIENIPNRFQALEGKTIAIDGTLITQRLFYTPDSRPHRHVLGWYQLIQELRQNKISVICFLMGRAEYLQNKTRSNVGNYLERKLKPAVYGKNLVMKDCCLKTLQVDPQLQQEHQSSMSTSDLAGVIQGQVNEVDRLGQLSNIHANLLASGSSSLDGTKSSHIFKEDPVGVETGLPGGLFSNKDSPSESDQDTENTLGSPSHVNGNDADVTAPEETIHIDVIRDDNKPKPEAEEYDKPQLGLPETAEHLSRQPEVRARASLELDEAGSSMTNTENFDVMAEHIPSFNRRKIDGSISALGAEADVQDMPTIPISRTQLKYTQEEGKIWKQLVTSPGSTALDLARVVEMVEQFASVELNNDELISDKTMLEEEVELPISERSAKLEERSGIMAASLTRRANPPTSLTYAESRLILEAMGVPCIQSYLPYEGEALACSLVLHGFADFVGSEDTVNFYILRFVRVLIAAIGLSIGRADVQRPFITEPDEPKRTSTNYTTLSRNKIGLIAVRVCGRSDFDGTDFVRRVGDMLEQEPKFRPSDVAEYLEQVKIARQIFSAIPPAPAVEDVLPGHWDEQAIYDVMSRFELQRYLEDGQIIPGH